MSKYVLTRHLLDFGTPFWNTEAMRKEFGSRIPQGFDATGRFGIGFFSVFMWADRISVTTRRFNAPSDSTLTLEIDSIDGKPILRNANPHEYLKTGGTKVRIWLRDPYVHELGGKVMGIRPTSDATHPCSDVELYISRSNIAKLFPSSDVNIYVNEFGEQGLAVAANDWVTMSSEDLLDRFVAGDGYAGIGWDIGNHAQCLRIIEDINGRIVGRCGIRWGSRLMTAGVVTIGGCVTSLTQDLVGILLAAPDNVARDRAIPIASRSDLINWSTEQARIVSTVIATDSRDNHSYLNQCAALIWRYGGRTGELPIARYGANWITFEQLKDIAARSSSLFLVSALEKSHFEYIVNDLDRGSNFDPETIVVDANAAEYSIRQFPRQYVTMVPWHRQESEINALPEWLRYWWMTLTGTVSQAVADGWGVPVGNLQVGSSAQHPEYEKRTIAVVDGNPLQAAGFVLRRPAYPSA